MSSYYRKQLEDWLKELEVRGDRVLDVGGAQLPVATAGRLKSLACELYHVMDLAKPHKNSGKPTIEADLNEPMAPDMAPEPYDVVFCLEVMEYIYNPYVAVHNLALLTTPGGVLFITFPYYYPPHEPLEHDTLRYTLGGATRLLSMAGFEVVEVIPRKSMGAGLKLAIETNALRASKIAKPDELFSLGFIIKATRT